MAEYQLIKFHAPWCGPCRALAPVIDEFIAQHADRVELVPVNVDEAPETAQRYSVMSVPTIILERDGKITERINGNIQRAQFFQKMEAALAG